jgi:hypothetical protein
MSTVAVWNHSGKGSKKFTVSSHRIYNPDGIATETNAKTTTKKNVTKYSGKDLQTLSFSVALSNATGTRDILSTERSWRKLIPKVGTFTLGGKSLGAKKFRLTKVGLSDIMHDNSGRVRHAVLALEFLEYRKAKKSKKSKKRKNSQKKSAKKKK